MKQLPVDWADNRLHRQVGSVEWNEMVLHNAFLAQLHFGQSGGSGSLSGASSTSKKQSTGAKSSEEASTSQQMGERSADHSLPSDKTYNTKAGRLRSDVYSSIYAKLRDSTALGLGGAGNLFRGEASARLLGLAPFQNPPLLAGLANHPPSFSSLPLASVASTRPTIVPSFFSQLPAASIGLGASNLAPNCIEAFAHLGAPNLPISNPVQASPTVFFQAHSPFSQVFELPALGNGSEPWAIEEPSTEETEESLRLHPQPSLESTRPLGVDGWPKNRTLDKSLEWKSPCPSGSRDTWWPMASWGPPGLGNPRHNLWASGGPCSKLDRLTGRRTQDYQAQHLRRGSTEVFDAIKNKIGLGDSERVDGLNAGHCNQVAGCSANFDEPKNTVTRKLSADESSGFWGLFHDNSVTFSPRDIKGLMALCFDDLVKKKEEDGEFGFTYEGYRYFKPPEDVSPESCTDPKHPMYRGWNDPNNPYPHHVIETVIKKWMVGEDRKVIAERKPGEELDNYCYDGCGLKQLRKAPDDMDPEAVPRGGTVRYYEINLIRQASEEEGRTFQCWVHESDEGEITSNWIRREPASFLSRALSSSRNDIPNFYWIANLQDDIKKGAPWIGFAKSTNPEVDMLEVWRLYKDSTVGVAKRHELEAKWHERIKEHAAILRQREAKSTCSSLEPDDN